MLSSPSLKLIAYADPLTGTLEQTNQAANVINTLNEISQVWIELNFSDVTGVSMAFSDEFFRLAEVELAETWLMPRNYQPSCIAFVNQLLGRIKQQREEAWIKGCEKYTRHFSRELADFPLLDFGKAGLVDP